jgi:hypothetical protein
MTGIPSKGSKNVNVNSSTQNFQVFKISACRLILSTGQFALANSKCKFQKTAHFLDLQLLILKGFLSQAVGYSQHYYNSPNSSDTSTFQLPCLHPPLI